MAGLADWLMWLGGGFLTAFTPLLAVVKRNRDRSRNNTRRLEGDDHEDGYEGLMHISKDTRSRVERVEHNLEQFRAETREEHAEVMDRLDEMADDEPDE